MTDTRGVVPQHDNFEKWKSEIDQAKKMNQPSGPFKTIRKIFSNSSQRAITYFELIISLKAREGKRVNIEDVMKSHLEIAVSLLTSNNPTEVKAANYTLKKINDALKNLDPSVGLKLSSVNIDKTLKNKYLQNIVSKTSKISRQDSSRKDRGLKKQETERIMGEKWLKDILREGEQASAIVQKETKKEQENIGMDQNETSAGVSQQVSKQLPRVVVGEPVDLGSFVKEEEVVINPRVAQQIDITDIQKSQEEYRSLMQSGKVFSISDWLEQYADQNIAEKWLNQATLEQLLPLVGQIKQHEQVLFAQIKEKLSNATEAEAQNLFRKATLEQLLSLVGKIGPTYNRQLFEQIRSKIFSLPSTEVEKQIEKVIPKYIADNAERSEEYKKLLKILIENPSEILKNATPDDIRKFSKEVHWSNLLPLVGELEGENEQALFACIKEKIEGQDRDEVVTTIERVETKRIFNFNEDEVEERKQYTNDI